MGVISIIGGTLLMLLGVLTAIVSYWPDFKYTSLFAFIALVQLFLGGFLWLVGVKLCGRENIQDRYWYIRRMARIKQQENRHE